MILVKSDFAHESLSELEMTNVVNLLVVSFRVTSQRPTFFLYDVLCFLKEQIWKYVQEHLHIVLKLPLNKKCGLKGIC